MANNVTWHGGKISRIDRNSLIKSPNKVIWLTGLSGSGKSSIAREVETQLFNEGILSFVLDGDNIRHGLNSDLGFTEDDRAENIRRIGEVAKLFHDAGFLVLVSFISPYKDGRRRVRKLIGESNFVEVFLDCPIKVCEERDPKNLYRLAKEGKINNFTGVDHPYEKPENPHITIDTSKLSVEQSANKIIDFIRSNNRYKFLNKNKLKQ